MLCVCRLAFILLLFISCHSEKDGQVTLQSGEDLFKQNCMACHGVNGQGSSLIKFNLKDRDSLKSPDAFQQIVLNGKEDTMMRGFSGRLTNEEIKKIYLFLQQEKE